MAAVTIALLLALSDSIPAHTTQAPVAIYRPEPQYTPEEFAAGIQGEVWISAVIDEKGIPTQIKVIRSLHPKLDAQALATAAQWRFKPSLRDGAPVATEATLAISFHLGAVKQKPAK